jgi:hypothetical protein
VFGIYLRTNSELCHLHHKLIGFYNQEESVYCAVQTGSLNKGVCTSSLTLSNPIFLPPAYSPALIYFGRERGWWVTCNYPSFKREKQKQKEYNLRYLLAKVCTT